MFNSVINIVGNTPLVKIDNCLAKNGAQIFVKLEEFNIGGSIKSRVGLQMIKDAENSKLIKKGDILIEPTGGNTGIGLAVGLP
jgi:cysteine synthase A